MKREHEHASRIAGGFTRLTGFVLLAAGVLGLILSITGLIVTAVYGPRLQRFLIAEIDSLEQALATTDEGLQVARSAVDDAEQALASTELTLIDATVALTDTLPILSTLTALSAEDLPQTVSSTRQALVSAGESAQVVDTMLAALSSLPFVGSQSYNPNVPLSTAIEQVDASLSDIPGSLRDVEAGLRTASGNLTGINQDLTYVAADVGAIRASVSDSGRVLDSYRIIVADLQGDLDRVKAGLPRWLGFAQLFLILLSIWLGLAQLGTLRQAWAMIQSERR
jgi:hypothetical protein